VQGSIPAVRNCIGEAEDVAQDSAVAFEIRSDRRQLRSHTESRRTQQPVERRERGFTVAALVGGDGRLRDAGTRGDLTLAQPGASPGVSEEGGEPAPVVHIYEYIRL
jgi:hypothetical protein